MLLVPFTPISFPARPAMEVMREPALVTSTRVPGFRVDASARMRNRAPAACAAM
jgi:hypothetical protein